MVRLAAIPLLAVSVVALASSATASVQPNERVPLVNAASEGGGWVSVQESAIDGLRILVVLKHLEPSTTYTVWLVNCVGPPGSHPCGVGPLTFMEPFGAHSPPGCPYSFGAGPLTTLTTNPAGNANSGAIRLDLSGVPSGIYHNHIDVRPSPCHPAGDLPPDAFTTETGFAFEV